ncbi:hypothetical protein Phum_PHUM142020 [Pediculus humanus corporis]|uniref:Uncharacterized protein n=1 Tax=Pediculus humanus subsp. corporis TaxID=121224 RepID=E0VEW0_PEDHC|nr:uncharacterized protein Phum_PHUM142020 [Pediculus humanus corporis]EEB11916.1 hypothetical protein Phum_PHUM142020 [Pediculus humanus corporis]
MADKSDLSPIKRENDNDFGLIEVNENDIPENSEVYVMEEPVEIQDKDGDEILETANNIVFRPLFRYRNKQQANLRRVSPGLRRRYFSLSF